MFFGVHLRDFEPMRIADKKAEKLADIRSSKRKRRTITCDIESIYGGRCPLYGRNPLKQLYSYIQLEAVHTVRKDQNVYLRTEQGGNQLWYG